MIFEFRWHKLSYNFLNLIPHIFQGQVHLWIEKILYIYQYITKTFLGLALVWHVIKKKIVSTNIDLW